MKIFIKTTAALICAVMMTSCGAVSDTDEVPELPEETAAALTYPEYNGLSVGDLLVVSQFSSPDSPEQWDEYSTSCLMSDGSVYTSNYKLNGDDTFHFRLFRDDPDAFRYFDEPTLTRQFSAEETEQIKQLISQIDPESDYYDVNEDEMGMTPDVEDYAHYLVCCYLTDENGTKQRFEIISYGLDKGTDYKTYDESALALLDLLDRGKF